MRAAVVLLLLAAILTAQDEAGIGYRAAAAVDFGATFEVVVWRRWPAGATVAPFDPAQLLPLDVDLLEARSLVEEPGRGGDELRYRCRAHLLDRVHLRPPRLSFRLDGVEREVAGAALEIEVRSILPEPDAGGLELPERPQVPAGGGGRGWRLGIALGAGLLLVLVLALRGRPGSVAESSAGGSGPLDRFESRLGDATSAPDCGRQSRALRELLRDLGHLPTGALALEDCRALPAATLGIGEDDRERLIAQLEALELAAYAPAAPGREDPADRLERSRALARLLVAARPLDEETP